MAAENCTEYVWAPQSRQAEAMGCPAFELFFGGAKGGGKSDFLLGDWLQHVPQWGRAWRGILFRRSYKELDELLTRAEEIFTKIEGAYYTGGDQKIWRVPAPNAKYPGYATLRFRSLDSDLDVGKYNGHQYPWIGFDELTEFPSSGPYEFMIGCCRSPHGAPCFIRSTGNPGRPGHVWVKARFIDVAEPGHVYVYAPNPNEPEKTLSRIFIPAKLEDNRILMEKDPDYESRLYTFAPHLVKALRYGDWEIVVGQVLSEYSREKHVIKQQPLDNTWFRFAAMDWGYKKPFSIGWWAVSPEGRMIRYKEWYGMNNSPNVGIEMGAKSVARIAWEMSVHENVTHMVADPACWTKIDDSPSVADSFTEAGFIMTKANNDRINGWMRVHELMKTTGQDGKPFLLIMDNCHHWLRTVPYLTADPRNPEDIDTEQEDHAADETRYAVMSDFSKNPQVLAPRKTLHASKSKPAYNPLTYGI